MKSIFITGSNGFIGNSLQNYLINQFKFVKYERDSKIKISQDIVMHLAGKAHDLKKTFQINEYYDVNTDLTKRIFDEFLNSSANVFITLSSVKAVADVLNTVLTEDNKANPLSHYGKSKLLSEQYILSKEIPEGKRVYILRPCMVHGPGNKGNLNLLYKIVGKGFPWPLGVFENKRSFCSIDNLCFVIHELIKNDKIASGVYNIADNETLSANQLISLIANAQGRKAMFWKIPKPIILKFAKIGDFFNLPFNSEKLTKLTESYVVSNTKIKDAIGKPLPINAIDGLKKTFTTFNY